MTRFVYDGSFDGFLCAVSRVLDRDGQAGGSAVAPAGEAQAELFSADEQVVTDAAAAGALFRRIVLAAGREEADMLAVAQASADPGAPGLLLSYVRRLLEAGAAAADDISRPEVLAVRKIRDRVMLEIHKMMGLVRFRKTADRLYYAAIEPDSNIVGFLGPHFTDRQKDQSFIIHDTRRGIAFWHAAEGSGGSCGIAELATPPERQALSPRDGVEELWREYFRRICISQRRNPALQARNMPRRYWTNLIEVQDRVKGK